MVYSLLSCRRRPDLSVIKAHDQWMTLPERSLNVMIEGQNLADTIAYTLLVEYFTYIYIYIYIYIFSKDPLNRSKGDSKNIYNITKDFYFR